jgi:uncharacterized membrane-anchored protein YitT (DUF2179 family)
MPASYLGTIRAMSVPTSDWILATVETVFVGGGLVVMKLFRRGDKDAAPALTVMDVFGCILGGLIFAVLTTFRLKTISWKSVLVAIIAAYLVAAFIDALVRRARGGTAR